MFVSVVENIGVDKAVPSQILNDMGPAGQGLTRQNIASHLQKYRNRRALQSISVGVNCNPLCRRKGVHSCAQTAGTTCRARRHNGLSPPNSHSAFPLPQETHWHNQNNRCRASRPWPGAVPGPRRLRGRARRRGLSRQRGAAAAGAAGSDAGHGAQRALLGHGRPRARVFAACGRLSRLLARGACDEFVTDFGPVFSVFFRDPDGLEAEVCVPNPDAVPGMFNPPGTPASRFASAPG